MSTAISSIIERLISRLVDDGALLLQPGVRPAEVADEVLSAMAQRDKPAQVGSFLAGVLVRSDQVDELFIDDQALARMLSEI